MCVCTLYAVTVSHIISKVSFLILLNIKLHFEAMLISLNETKFNNDCEQFEFGTHAVHYIGCEIV